MKVSAEPIENSQITLNIEMEATEVDKYLERAYSRLVKKVSVPGFRRGKTPRAILEQHIGKDTLLREALEDLIPRAYKEAAESQEIDAIAQPQFELVRTEPLTFKAIVPLKPVVRLGDYKKVRFEFNPAEIGEEDIKTTIEQLRDQQAVLSPVERQVEFGDVVTIDIDGERQGEHFPIRKDFVYEVTKGARLPLLGFAEKLLGMRKGEEKKFALSYPPDYETQELAGKEYTFRVKVLEVKEKKLPEVDDEFAKSLGSQDLASLKEKIAANLKARAEERARSELEQKVIDAVVELSEVQYPPILVDREIDRLLDEEVRHFSGGIIGLENYLKNLNKTIDEHREELRPLARRRVVRSLVVENVAKAEKIEVDDSEINEEVERMARDAGKQVDEARKLLTMPQTRESIRQFLAVRKTVGRLVEIATGSTRVLQGGDN